MMKLVALDRKWLRARALPVPGDGGKEERGRVVVIGGREDLVGATRLTGEAALRVGAGKLQLAAPASATAALSLVVPEARVIARPGRLPWTRSTRGLVEAVERCDAVVIGPGMLQNDEALARELAAATRGPLVLDAAALSAASAVQTPHVVLTPHAGEMAALLGVEKEAVEADPLDAALTAATRFRAVVALKGAKTLIVDPDREMVLYPGGGAGLGTSGSGDVLAGAIVGLLARGASPFQAAAWGVYLHGEAGRRLAARLGPLGFLAREIADEFPEILRATA